MNEELYYIQERIDTIKAYINELQMRKLEYEMTKLSLKEMKEGDEILVPLGSGIFFNARVGKLENVFVNIGADIVMEKSIEETIKIIDEQIKKVDKMIEEYMEELEYWYRMLEEYAKAAKR